MIQIALSPQEAELLFVVLGTAQPTAAAGPDASPAVRNAMVMAHASTIQQIQTGLKALQGGEQAAAEEEEPKKA